MDLDLFDNPAFGSRGDKSSRRWLTPDYPIGMFGAASLMLRLAAQ